MLLFGHESLQLLHTLLFDGPVLLLQHRILCLHPCQAATLLPFWQETDVPCHNNRKPFAVDHAA